MSSLLDQFEFPVRRSRYVCREMSEEDVNTALLWFKSFYGGKDFPRDFLPETGVSVSVNGELVCVIPIYFENSSNVAILGHCMVNHHFNKKQTCFAVKKCIEYAIEYASARGKNIWFLFSEETVSIKLRITAVL